MKWVLLFLMIIPGESGHNISLERIEFQSLPLCEKAITQMVGYNKAQESEASQLKSETGQIQALIGFKPIVCFQVAK